MNIVKEILDIKGRDVWSISASKSVYEAIETMEEMQVGALTVLDDDFRLAGIISERDFARKVILKNKSAHETCVADIMTTDVVVVGEETILDKCMSLMSHRQDQYRDRSCLSLHFPWLSLALDQALCDKAILMYRPH